MPFWSSSLPTIVVASLAFVAGSAELGDELSTPPIDRSIQATFVVNSAATTEDGDPGDGVCDTGSVQTVLTNICTLNAAAQEANALAQSTVISFVTGTDSVSATVTFSVPITIDGSDGAGRRRVIVDPGTFSFDFGSSGSVIRNLEIRGSGPGISFSNGSANNVVEGCYIHGNSASGIFIRDSENNLIGGPTDTPGRFPGNVISGNGDAGIEVSTSSTIFGGNVVEGNLIGTDSTGLAAMPNEIGIEVSNAGSYQLRIGGLDTRRRNVISGNNRSGIELGRSGSVNDISGATVLGNYIGVDITGGFALPNVIGVSLYSVRHTIGGADPGARNLISGNNSDGVRITSGTAATVQGNWIGINADGTNALANTGNGIDVGTVADSVRILDNVVSGNELEGIRIRGDLFGGSTTGQIVDGNFVGTSSSGLYAIPNKREGIFVSDVDGVSIGTVKGNVISGNLEEGITLLRSIDVFILKNLIGTDSSGTAPVPNGLDGIFLDFDAIANRIGEPDAPERGNIIAFNGGDGIAVDFGTSAIENAIRANSIHSNAGIGIDLNEEGVTPNDPGDADVGANQLQNHPVISQVVSGPDSTRITGVLESTPGTMFEVDFFSNEVGDTEGEKYIGMLEVMTDGSGVANIATAFPGTHRGIAATATDPDGNTSELSAVASGLIVNSTGDAPDTTPGDGVCDTGETIVRPSGDEPECTLFAAMSEANAVAGADRITFNIEGSPPHTIAPAGLPDIDDPVAIVGPTSASKRAGVAGVPEIIIDGGGAGPNGFVVTFDGRGSEIKNLAIIGFSGDAIVIDGSVDNAITGCYIGTRGGAFADANGGNGIVISEGLSNVVGGEGPSDGNVISGNGLDGVVLTGASTTLNSIVGNHIGTNTAGDVPLGNFGNGIRIDAGARGNTVRDNVLSGNLSNGILIEGDESAQTRDTGVFSNYIGTSADGMAAVANGDNGIMIVDSRTNLIGNVTTLGDREGNVISGNLLSGIRIVGPMSGATIVHANLIGVSQDESTDLGNRRHGVVVENSPRVTIGHVVALEPGTEFGNVISGNDSTGIHLVGDVEETIIEGNTIGVSPIAGESFPNAVAGVSFQNAFGARLGGSTPSSRNEIAENDKYGVLVEGADSDSLEIGNNVISNNGEDGVRITDGHRITVWGGDIENNGAYGVRVDGGSAVRVGVVTSATDSLTAITGNETGGVLLQDRADNVIIAGADIVEHPDGPGVTILESSNHVVGSRGPAGSGLPNTINVNTVGVIVRGSTSTNNRLAGNFVGLTRTGDNAYNIEGGIQIDVGAHHNVVGGETTTPGTGRGNVISGQGPECLSPDDRSNGAGVRLEYGAGRGNRIEGNLIGLDPTGLSELGNCIGILVYGGDSTVVGGRASNQRNVISGNFSNHVEILGGDGVRVEGNYIGLNALGTELVYKSLLSGINGVRVAGGGHHQIGGDVLRAGLAPGNVIAVAGGTGVHVSADNLRVQGNLIGTDANGNPVSIGSDRQLTGVEVRSGLRPVVGGIFGTHGNVISDNVVGVSLAASVIEARIGGNVFGRTASGETLSNDTAVSLLGSSGTLIGGQSGFENVITSSIVNGILMIDTGTSRIVGNFLTDNKTGIIVFFADDLLIAQNVGSGNGTFLRQSMSRVRLVNNNITGSTDPNTGVNLTSSTATISGNRIADNAGNGVFVDSSSVVTMSDNTLTGNLAFGVETNDVSSMVSAQNNWWGDPLGPGGSGNGNGDAVSDNVDFSNWNTEAPSLVLNLAGDTVFVSPGTEDTLFAYLRSWTNPTDMVSLEISDSEGWVSVPGVTTESLDADLGVSVPIPVAVPGGVGVETSSVVSVEATSQADLSDVKSASLVIMAYEPALAELFVSPDTVSMRVGSTRMFVANGRDQLGRAFAFAPTWTASGGNIDVGGVYVAGNTPGTFAVTASDPSGPVSASAVVTVTAHPVGNELADDIPTAFALHNAYPNPFNRTTTIPFDVKQSTRVVLRVYDLLGRVVETTVDREYAAGHHSVTFDGQGRGPGIYVYVVRMGDFVASRTMVLVR